MAIAVSGGQFQQKQPNPKVLFSGAIPNTGLEAYAVPKSTQTEFTAAYFFNTSGSTSTVSIMIEAPGASPITVYQLSLTTGSSAKLIDADRLMLTPGYSLRLIASVDLAVECIFTGIEWFLPTGGSSV